MGDAETTTYIATLDVGTTTVRCHVVDSSLDVVSTATEPVALLYPQPGFVEIDPEHLWGLVRSVTDRAIAGAGLEASQVAALAVAAQRSTFVTWRRSTGRPFHNFIAWKDMRSKRLVRSWNRSLTFRAFRAAAYIAYLCTRNRRFLMASDLTLSTIQCTGRLLWAVENVPDLADAVRRSDVCFATLDTWLVYRLSGRRLFVSDVASASSTGLFDPFAMEWSAWPRDLLGLPLHAYADVVATDHDFGCTEREIFGASIPLRCVTADQQASMFASWHFGRNALKATLGTGSFVDARTGRSPHASVAGIYPLVAWRLGAETTYVAEAACNDAGSLVQWLLNVGLVRSAEETSALAAGVADADGVYFVPAFSGLGPPISDDAAASGFFGVKATTRREHLVRAALESVVFRVVLSLDVLAAERGETYERICVDGGVSSNDFVCRMLADLSGLDVVRFRTHDLSVIGATLIAGVNAGIWKKDGADGTEPFGKVRTVFAADAAVGVRAALRANLRKWLAVVERYKSWYVE